MGCVPFRSVVLTTALGLAIGASPAGGQGDSVPKVSARSFVSGSAMIVVRGTVQIDAEMPINTVASFGDGEMTWLQFGDSGSAAPNVGVTFSSYEVGVSVGRGRFIATGGFIPGERSECSGETEVTASSVTGQYKCVGVTSYEPGGSGSGMVDIDIRFAANT
jgi:hypothetical protein